jgi:hypothetical protein
MPEGAEPLFLFRDSVIARIFPHARLTERTFLMVCIGADLPDDVYLDFVANGSNRLLFEARTREQLKKLPPSEFDALDFHQIENLFFKERLNVTNITTPNA